MHQVWAHAHAATAGAAAALYLECVRPLPCKCDKAQQCCVGRVGDAYDFSDANSCRHNDEAGLRANELKRKKVKT